VTESYVRGPLPGLPSSLALAVVGGVAYFLGFPGFDLFPLAFVALVPLVLLLEREAEASWKRRAGLAFVYGLVEFLGGYSWLQSFLEEFSGFPFVVTAALTTLFCGALALYTVAFALLYGRARKNGWPVAFVVVVATVALEAVFPMMFPSYLGNSLHDVPIAIQIADLSGPLLVSAFVACVNGALAEVVLARRAGAPFPRVPVAIAVATTIATLGYGAYRIGEVDARASRAPSIEVAMVQVNMGTFQKREDPYTGHRRHLEQSHRIESQHVPDLFVWPESAFTFAVPKYSEIADLVTPDMQAPVLFGALDLRPTPERPDRVFNTAFLVDANDRVVGRYDKTFLVPFGEYIPFGSIFPELYDLSPNTGRFETGTSLESMHLGAMRLSVFVCYEDLLPEFTRKLVRVGRPNVLVNLTNDAWYGDTHEPWIHLALAKFRAVEHHRALIRSTNSGVSAFVDPVGRVVSHTGVFTREDLVEDVPLLDRGTVFEVIGERPLGALACVMLAWMVVRRRRPG